MFRGRGVCENFEWKTSKIRERLSRAADCSPVQTFHTMQLYASYILLSRRRQISSVRLGLDFRLGYLGLARTP